MSRSQEARRWEIRKMKTAGIDVEQEYSDDDEEADLVHIEHLPAFLDAEDCSEMQRSDIAIEKPYTEMSAVAKRRSVFLDTQPRSAADVSGESVKRESEHSPPIHRFRDELMRFVGEHQTVVLVGDTGSGKSTQVPQYLHAEGYGARGLIGCTEPRRVAATSLSRMLRRTLGTKVGHAVRFDDTTTPETVIKFMTEGVLLQELLGDSLLRRYSVIIVDEAHERSMSLDISLGLLKGVLRRRKDLKLIVMSATMHAEKFCAFLECPVFRVAGRSFPVEIEYLKTSVDDYAEWAVKRVLDIHSSGGEGDILVFATGKEDVEGIAGILRHMNGERDLKVLPFHSQLSLEKQGEVFEELSVRRCIVSTNVAETSLTIPNIRYVVDCGLQKTSVYSYNLGETLATVPISRANADQRAGRAGRTRPGMCYRMYTQRTYEEELLSDPVPEIQRANACSVVLLLLQQGLDVKGILEFDFVDSPSPRLIRSALFLLHRLDAVDSSGVLTDAGRMIADLRLDPLLGRMVLDSIRFRCVDEVLSISSVLGVEEAFHRDFDRGSSICHPNCDFLTILNVFNEFLKQRKRGEWCGAMQVSCKALEKAVELKKASLAVLARKGIEISSSQSPGTVQRSILTSLHSNVAKRRNREYVCLSTFATCRIHPSSMVSEGTRYVLFYKHMTTKSEYIYCCSAVDPQAVLRDAGRHYRDRRGERAVPRAQIAEPEPDIRAVEKPVRVHAPKIDTSGSLYDRFERWSSEESEDAEATKRVRRGRI